MITRPRLPKSGKHDPGCKWLCHYIPQPPELKLCAREHSPCSHCDPPKVHIKHHKHVMSLFAGNGQAFWYCNDNGCEWRKEYVAPTRLMR